MSRTKSHPYDDNDSHSEGFPPPPPPADLLDDEDAAHTFRKRRLSLPMHRLNQNNNSSSTTTSANGSTVLKIRVEPNEEFHDEPPPFPTQRESQQTLQFGNIMNGELEDDGSTFRKRRLSLTALLSGSGSSANNSTTSPAAQVLKRHHHHEDININTTVEDDAVELPGEKDHNNNLQQHDCGDGAPQSHIPTLLLHPSRTVHAGELRGGDDPASRPSSPTSSFASRSLGDNSTMVTPRWKRRHTIDPHGTEPDHLLLPFDRHIVGMYSCHGMEPIYESDYENTNDDDDSDDDDDIDNSPVQETEPTDTLLHSSSPQPQPNVSVVKKINQDRGGVVFPYGNCPRTALFAVYDGHGQGGELVSQFCLHEIQHRLEQHPQIHSSPSQALVDTFLTVDEKLRHEPLIEPFYSGTTACVALLRNRTLTLANCGDSRAVCARKIRNPPLSSSVPEAAHPPSQQWLALDLTQDQNPDVPSEWERIVAMGGYVTLPPAPGLSARVWLDPACTQIGLAMARSLGDHAVAPIGVLAEPVISTHTITPDDDFIILATDGVWEFLDSAQAVEIVGQQLHQHHQHNDSTTGVLHCACATKACQALIEAAAKRWHEEEGSYRDDITAIVVRLQELWDFTDSSTEEEEEKSSSSESITTEQTL